MNTYELRLLKDFSTHFSDFANRRIAIYGLGYMSKIIIDNCPSINIVGLLDKTKTEGMEYGKRIIALSDVLILNVDMIILITLPANMSVIYSRISSFCADNAIMVYGMNGRRLDEPSEPMMDVFERYSGKTDNKFIIDEFLRRQTFVKDTRGRLKISVEGNYEIGRSFIAPIACKFLSWIAQRSMELQLDILLFAARDCYVLNKMADIIGNDKINFPPYTYFHTSRAACLLAGLKTDEDIINAALSPFEGIAEEMLERRFYLRKNEVMQRHSIEESDLEFILRHRAAINRNAERENVNYQKYIKSLQIPQNARIGFVDLLSGGTSQMGLEKIMQHSINGLYFAYLFNDYKDYLDTDGLFEVECFHTSQYYIVTHHYLLETIFTSFEPTLKSFDFNGYPILGLDSRSNKHLRALHHIQNGMLDYADTWDALQIDFQNVDIGLLDFIVHLLSAEYSIIKTDYLETGELEDEFANRSLRIL
jgi:hypothetical protein